MNLTRMIVAAPLAVAALTLFAAAGPPAEAAKARSCTRGGATLEAAAGGVRVVRVAAKKQSTFETRREHLLACWTKTGRRIVVSREVDHGDDNRASTRVEIVDGRYVGVREHNEGGVSESIQARVYDVRKSKLLHTSKECDFSRGDMGGVDDVAFLEGGGMAMTCDRLLLYRKAGSALETLEPAGTNVRQIGVSRYSHGFGARLFWTVATGEFGETQTAKSIAL